MKNVKNVKSMKNVKNNNFDVDEVIKDIEFFMNNEKDILRSKYLKKNFYDIFERLDKDDIFLDSIIKCNKFEKLYLDGDINDKKVYDSDWWRMIDEICSLFVYLNMNYGIEDDEDNDSMDIYNILEMYGINTSYYFEYKKSLKELEE